MSDKRTHKPTAEDLTRRDGPCLCRSCQEATQEELATLRDQNAALVRDREQLLRFAWGGLLVHQTGNDWYGGDLQDHLEACGLLIQQEMAAPCDPDRCGCAAVSAFPCICYRHTALAAAARCVRALATGSSRA